MLFQVESNYFYRLILNSAKRFWLPNQSNILSSRGLIESFPTVLFIVVVVVVVVVIVIVVVVIVVVVSRFLLILKRWNPCF